MKLYWDKPLRENTIAAPVLLQGKTALFHITHSAETCGLKWKGGLNLTTKTMSVWFYTAFPKEIHLVPIPDPEFGYEKALRDYIHENIIFKPRGRSLNE